MILDGRYGSRGARSLCRRWDRSGFRGDVGGRRATRRHLDVARWIRSGFWSLLRDEARVDSLARNLLEAANQDGVSHLRDAEEALGKIEWNMDATVRTGLAWVVAAVDGHAVPSQTLHVGHGCLVIFLGVIREVFGQDGVGARGGGMTFDASADGAAADLPAVTVDIERLICEVHDDADGARRRSLRIPNVLVRLEDRRVRGLQGAMLNRKDSQALDGEDENGRDQCGGRFIHVAMSLNNRTTRNERAG